MVLISFLLTIRIVLQIFLVKIPQTGISISFSWIPVYIAGWFFGPIAGLVFGMFTDTFCWMIFSGIWFWMYAIQEAIIGFIAGIFGGLYYLSKKSNLKFQIIFQNIASLLFLLTSVLIVAINYSLIEGRHFSRASKYQNKNIFLIIFCVAISIFFIVISIQNIYWLRKYKRIKSKQYLLFVFVSTMLIFTTTLMSFILGPITAIKYFEFINHRPSSLYLKYGVMFYLIPRVLKETIKTPIYIFLVVSLITALNGRYRTIINNARNQWAV